MIEQVIEQLNESADTIKSLDSKAIYNSAKLLFYCLANNKKILLCGNGGSAADCQHFAAELVVRFRADIKRPALPAIALTTDTSIITAAGNDFGFENIFSQQIAALGNKDDVLIAISTSGNSPNIINAINKAKQKGMKVVGLLGNDGGQILNKCDLAVVVNHNTTARIQEAHILIEHI